MSKRETLAVWVCVDSDGTYETGGTADEARERFDENIGGNGRIFCVKIDVPLPLSENEAEDAAPTAKFPDEAGEAHVTPAD